MPRQYEEWTVGNTVVMVESWSTGLIFYKAMGCTVRTMDVKYTRSSFWRAVGRTWLFSGPKVDYIEIVNNYFGYVGDSGVLVSLFRGSRSCRQSAFCRQMVQAFLFWKAKPTWPDGVLSDTSVSIQGQTLLFATSYGIVP